MQALADEDVRAAPAEVVILAVREALERFGRGELVAPPRVRAPLGEFDYVFTTGAFSDVTCGFRTYRASSPSGPPPGDQLLAVWDADGHLSGIVVGDELGSRRTGALGAVAADALARPDAATLGVVGAGPQAWAALWALTAVRSLRRVRVFSPNAEHRERFSARARAELSLEVAATNAAPTAVRDADLVVLATRSTEPVIERGDIGAGAHVTTVGPKTAARSGKGTPTPRHAVRLRRSGRLGGTRGATTTQPGGCCFVRWSSQSLPVSMRA